MLRFYPAAIVAVLGTGLIAPAHAIVPERDFSGKWFLDNASSNTRALPMRPETSLTVSADDVAVRCTAATADGATTRWSYLLDGTETRMRAGADSHSTIVKWEGAALLVNTQVTGSQDYTVMDRWKLSRDRSVLTITRQVERGGRETEGVLVYTRDAQPTANESSATEPTERAAVSTPAMVKPAPAPTPVVPPSRPALVRQPDRPAPDEITVRSGMRIALALRNGLDTKHTRQGDRVYLETIQPVAVDGQIVIPRGSYVNGTVTESKPAHGVKGKGEMFIRFDSLMLPNGVSRDFHSRLISADSAAQGNVDSKEGKVTGERDGSGDARTIATGTGVGATVGVIAGSAAGHPITGLGVGAAAGAGVALATILHGKRPEAVLPRGTIVEMILDRDLNFRFSELR